MNTPKPFTIKRWTLATFWGWLLGVALILLLSSLLDSIGVEDMQFYLGVGMGAGVSFTQWLMLRKYTLVNKNWIWFAIAGMGIPFAIIDFIPVDTLFHRLSWRIAIAAFTTGVLQYFVLRKHLTQAYLWIPACMPGWIAAMATVNLIDHTRELKQVIPNNLIMALINLLLILAGGVVLGIITGIALKKILNTGESTAPKPVINEH